ncbi:Tfp pilus assembly protein FimT/FimU [Vogesella sp. GCM10023246]|uniref:Prepilin-type N-terminal cleavage/methylation domain-containing protein n=1 Tax=Vogesella oryzagri TaxID=3160864 RepID=A0ABV1M8D1_9NEIS
MIRQHGFTVFEAMVVMTIIGVFAAIAIPNFNTSIKKTKIRKTADLVAQAMGYAKSYALDKNATIYFSVQASKLCLSRVSASGCELRSDSMDSDVAASMKDTSGSTPANISSFSLSGVYGTPTPKDVTATVSANGFSQSVNMNIIGLVTVGGLQ